MELKQLENEIETRSAEWEAAKWPAAKAPRRYQLTPAESEFFRRHLAALAARANLESAIQGAMQLIADQQGLAGAKFKLTDDCAALVEVED